MLNEKGNAILVCRVCSGQSDKGCPPLPGQDDSAFVCEKCQGARNVAAIKAKLAVGLPKMEVE